MTASRTPKCQFAIGDLVAPRHLWRNDPNNIPRGRVVKIMPWGDEGALYVAGDHRAFAASVFRRVRKRRRRS